MNQMNDDIIIDEDQWKACMQNLINTKTVVPATPDTTATEGNNVNDDADDAVSTLFNCLSTTNVVKILEFMLFPQSNVCLLSDDEDTLLKCSRGLIQCLSSVGPWPYAYLPNVPIEQIESITKSMEQSSLKYLIGCKDDVEIREVELSDVMEEDEKNTNGTTRGKLFTSIYYYIITFCFTLCFNSNCLVLSSRPAFSLLPSGVMAVNLRLGTLEIKLNDKDDMKESDQALLPNSRNVEVALRKSLRPKLFSLDTLNGYDQFVKLSMPMIHRNYCRSDIRTKENELKVIVQKHIKNIFYRPLKLFTSTVYHLRKDLLVDTNENEEKIGHFNKVVIPKNTPQTVSFFANKFLYHLSNGDTSRQSGGILKIKEKKASRDIVKIEETNYENDDNSDVTFYSKIFRTRLWYQWLSKTKN